MWDDDDSFSFCCMCVKCRFYIKIEKSSLETRIPSSLINFIVHAIASIKLTLL